MFFQRFLLLSHKKIELVSSRIKSKCSLYKGSNTHLVTAPSDEVHTRCNSFGRTALFTFGSQKGSLTLETAIVLPIFLFFCMMFVFLCQVFYIHCEIQGSLFQAARYLSGNALYAQVAVSKDLQDVELVQKAIGIAAARQKVIEYSADELDKCVCLQNGSNGLQFLYSSITEEYVDLIVNYRVQLPYSFGLDASFPIVQRCRIRAWTGCSGEINNNEEEVVYITENGIVYHVNPDCTHLKLTIKQIQEQDLAEARNYNGSKYKSCDKCAKNGLEGKSVYITEDGDRYHNTLNCSGLKRSVQQIPKSQISGKSVCKRCGR